MNDNCGSAGKASMKEAKPRKRFQFQTYRPEPTKVPRAADLVIGVQEQHVPPSESIKSMIRATPLVAGIDIETHDLLGRHMKWWRGPFGFWTLADPNILDQARIVQIGWSKCEDTREPTFKQLLVRPCGFEITPASSAKHNITNDEALEEGIPLRAALQEFIDDMVAFWRRGGQVVAHHLEFDAGIIAKELERSGLGHLKDQWRKIVASGVCTMDPDIAHWVRDLLGMEQVIWKSAMKLEEMTRKLVPDCDILLQKKHTAGGDAQMAALLYRELCKRACDNSIEE